MTMAPPPHHEKQGKFNQLCLVHALNMLVGESITSKERLDHVCETLSPASGVWSWNNPHRSVLGGNYDVNVGMYVLQEHGLDATFFDGRKTAKDLIQIICDQEQSIARKSDGDDEKDKDTRAASLSCNAVVGLLVNVPGTILLPGSRHWISYRPFDSSWWRLDSKEAQAIEVPMDMLLSRMESHLKKGDHILIVRRNTAATRPETAE